MGVRSRHRSADIATTVSRVLRALSACAPAALLGAPPALAQTFEPTSLAADIPARPLADALAAFARQTGLQLVYVSGVVRNRKSHPAAAGLGADEALDRLLQGTGLRFEYLTAHSIRILPAAGEPPQASARTITGNELSEVIVTATRREEDLQDVPITLQVLTGDVLAQLNATTFDDFVGYLPGIVAHGVGPGQSSIYMRGLGTSEAGIQGAGFIGAFPTVALYLDDQSAQLPHRNLDLYAADLERIEVLEGPQGTLFGAGAQAGAVRYITNKPKLNVTEALLNTGYATTAHGAASNNLDATINIPLLTDQLAVRGLIYNERRGGYIDNRPATFARAATDVGIAYAGGTVPANSVVINNFKIAGNNINPVTYSGLRLEALYRIDEHWSALLTQSFQSMEADGVFAEMAANSLGERQPALSAQLYNRSYDRDRFENTALTIEGRVGALKVLYAGAYLARDIEQVQDYTNYVRAAYVDYYQCVNPGPPGSAQCFTPSSTWRDLLRNTHQSHELRMSTPGEWRIRAIGGLFYEKYGIQDQSDWFYLTALPYFNPIGPATGYYTLNGSQFLPNGTQVGSRTPGAVFVPLPVTSNNPSIRPLGDGFFNDITRGYTQQAAYTSVDFDLIPSRLTLTGGTRYFRTDNTEVGSAAGSFGCSKFISNPAAPNPCVNSTGFININSEGLERAFSGFKSRANLSWKATDDALLYYTWSQGFRAGGFNRSAFICQCGSPLSPGPFDWQAQARAHQGWQPPLVYAPDSLVNNELGWKTKWMDQRIQWDGAVYQEDWNHAQIDVGSPGVLSAGLTLNGGSYRVRGVETSGVARVTGGLTIEAHVAWNHSELVQPAIFLWADGTPIDFSALTTFNKQKLSDPGGVLGSPLAGAPPFQGNIRARYELAFNGYAAFAQLVAAHQSHSLATTDRLSLDLQGHSVAYDLPAFTIYDAALGIERNAWLVQVYGENFTDTHAALNANYAQWYRGNTVTRPRTIGLRLSYKFGRS